MPNEVDPCLPYAGDTETERVLRRALYVARKHQLAGRARVEAAIIELRAARKDASVYEEDMMDIEDALLRIGAVVRGINRP